MNTSSLYEKCTQCPRKCGVNRLSSTNNSSAVSDNATLGNTESANTAATYQKGFCGENEDVRVAVACLHFGEEPLVTVFGGSGTIFFTGCTLNCAICQNYQISRQGMGTAVSKAEFVKMCLKLESAGAENINLVTGSHCIPKLADYLKAAQNAGLSIPFCWNSSAYESVEMLELLKGLVKIWLPDFKTLNTALAQKLMGAENYPQAAKDAVSWM